jgi:hypothetical protein
MGILIAFGLLIGLAYWQYRVNTMNFENKILGFGFMLFFVFLMYACS